VHTCSVLISCYPLFVFISVIAGFETVSASSNHKSKSFFLFFLSFLFKRKTKESFDPLDSIWRVLCSSFVSVLVGLFGWLLLDKRDGMNHGMNGKEKKKNKRLVGYFIKPKAELDPASQLEPLHNWDTWRCELMGINKDISWMVTTFNTAAWSVHCVPHCVPVAHRRWLWPIAALREQGGSIGNNRTFFQKLFLNCFERGKEHNESIGYSLWHTVFQRPDIRRAINLTT